MKKIAHPIIVLMIFAALQLLQSKQCLGFGSTGYAQNLFPNSLQNDNFISNLKQLSIQQLLDTGDYYYNGNDFETALTYYNTVINANAKDADVEQQKKIIEAYNKSAALYYYMSDYRSAYDFLIKALLLCEKHGYAAYESRIYNNLGTIYTYFKKYDMAKQYYSRALSLSEDSVGMVVMLNNLGALELSSGKTDGAFDFLNRSLQISKRHSDIHLDGILNSIALFYEKTQQPDSAFYYFHLALDEAKKNNKIEYEADNLSGIGKLFFEINRLDSAFYYIDLSNMIATENSFLAILAENHLTLSKIEESKRNTKKAFEHYKEYANLKDSVFNAEKFGEINQLQRLYEVSKTNQQIEELVIEQQIKEREIKYHRIIWLITLSVLLLVGTILFYIFIQKRNLNKAYKALVEKNIEIMGLLKQTSETKADANKKYILNDKVQNQLLNNILSIMEDTSIICDVEFSIDKLAVLTQSNQKYVSDVIKTSFSKNFRSFLNGYRIREAQRLFIDFDDEKYTIESITAQVGFKSRNTFYEAFKEITGVNPGFYLKSIRKQNGEPKENASEESGK